MTFPNRFTHALAFAALASSLLSPLHAQTANNTTKPANNSGNMTGNHKDVMSTAAQPNSSQSSSSHADRATTPTAPGNQKTSEQPAEVRTEKIKYKQTNVDQQATPVDDTIQKKHVANVTAAPGDDNNPIKHVPPGNSASTSTSSSTTAPQAAQDKTKFKQEFGPTQANKKN